MSWYIRPCWSAKAELSVERRKAVNPLRDMVIESTEGAGAGVAELSAEAGGRGLGSLDCWFPVDTARTARSSDVCGGELGGFALLGLDA